MSHVRCITDVHQLAEGASWCGKAADQFEWRFTDIDHAALNGRNGGYLTVCPRCRAAVIAGLKNKTAEGALVQFNECDASKNNDPINGHPIGGDAS